MGPTRSQLNRALSAAALAVIAPTETAMSRQMGSAESGSTIKVRSAGRPRAAGQRMVVRAPPFDHPK